ncbi:hypothetical protein [Futiania mangrovi]|uniref:Uncharacterized protein n=1 Tax=Futiania mangrovi TaxID=2959716 RepID=A0A9J6PCG7_9PROT|nr:hypothetical protein [Futiania mangrovii]MCP1335958.1 hypothetical protein [Futiania mangrovii]
MSGIDNDGAAPADWQGVSGDAPEAFGNELTIAQETGNAGCRPMTWGERAQSGALHGGGLAGSVGLGVGGAMVMQNALPGLIGGGLGDDDGGGRNALQNTSAVLFGTGLVMVGQGVRYGVENARALRNETFNPDTQVCQ